MVSNKNEGICSERGVTRDLRDHKEDHVQTCPETRAKSWKLPPGWVGDLAVLRGQPWGSWKVIWKGPGGRC